jgi:hypothetical protein
MPRRKKPSTVARRKQASSIAALRKVGLTKSKAGKSGKKLGGSAYSLLRKFSAVIEKRAAVVKASPATVKKYKNTFRTTRNRIVVPKSPGETVRVTGGTVTKRKVVTPNQRPISIIIPPKITSLTDLPRGPGYRYRVRIGSATRLYMTFELLEQDFSHYTKFNVGFIEVIPPEKRGRRNRVVDDDEETDE